MTLYEEMISAGQGLVALLTGRRDAGGYFDLTLRGLAGSFVAFLFATTLNAYLPALMGTMPEDTGAAQTLLVAGALYAVQIGCGVLVLNQIGRLDGVVPYLVADNWATFFVTAVTIALSLFQFSPELVLIFVGIVVLILEINIARLIVTLTPLQIAMFLIAQMVGVVIGLFVIGALMPVPEGAATL